MGGPLDDTWLDDSARPAHASGQLVQGKTVGRYVIEREHARGGLGVVAIALDPELGRNVALKMLRPDLAGRVPEHLRDEARAMAKLSHPNVISVYDAGEVDGQIFIAMELVDGVTLRDWLARAPRSWREVVRALVLAGRGLAAAHRANLVHRDFKPENVLCGPDDRVRVGDFGLARGSADGGGEPELGIGSGIVGTPRYMPPEVWRGEPATARSDQWSFCVALYEALFGTPPFAGVTMDELRAAIDKGAPPPPPRPHVPARVLRAMMRGLAVAPAARFADMDALLRELEAVLHRPRPLVLAGGAVAVAAVAGVAVFALRGDRVDPCQMPPSLIASAWSPARGDAIAAAFAASGRVHGPESARRVRKLLDDYSAQWLAARTDACVATRVRGDQSEAVLDARTRCLDRRRDELGELARVLADTPTGAVVDRAVDAALGLHGVDTCTSTGVRTEVPLPNDPARSAQIVALDKEIAAARAELLVARTDVATSHARSIVARAKPLGYAPVTARALRLLSNLAGYMTDRAEGERTINEAIAAAAAAHEDVDAADMWIVLMSFTASQRGDGAAALELAKPAEAALLRADSPANLRCSFHNAQGTAYAKLGKHREARDAYEAALRDAPTRRATAMTEASLCGVEQKLGNLVHAAELCTKGVAALEADLGPQHPVVGFALLNLGNTKLVAGDNKAARAVLERALAILKDSLGEKHITYANALNSLARAASQSGDIAGARSAYQRALAVYDAAHSPDAFLPLANLGNLDRDAGRAAEARTEWERALAIAEATQGAASERAAQAHQALGNLDFDAGKLAAAAPHYERALELTIAVYGEQHHQTGGVLDGLANLYIARRDWKRAAAYARRALAVYEAVFDVDHPNVAEALALVANCQTELGDPAAIATLERALAIYDHHPDADSYDAANTRWLLAQALRRFHRDPARAVALANEARALFAKSTIADAKQVIADIDRWLRRR